MTSATILRTGTDAYHEYTTTASVTVRTSDAPEDWFGQLDARYS